MTEDTHGNKHRTDKMQIQAFVSRKEHARFMRVCRRIKASGKADCIMRLVDYYLVSETEKGK